MKKIFLIVAILALIAVLFYFVRPNNNTSSEVVKNYSKIVFAGYFDSLNEAKKMQKEIDNFLDNPSAETLATARKSWIEARIPYLQTEAFRFYEGPIDFTTDFTTDFTDQANKKSGPETRINAWPLNEAYIDYVKGDKKAGIINNPQTTISKEAIAGKNQEKDEADVSSGYHAIEFLLWGQDLSVNGPGNRSYQDYVGSSQINERRRLYLKETVALLVDDLQFLVDSWEMNKNNYRQKFIANPQESIAKILTGISTLSGFELASERIATALDSGDQEDEDSCFSDTTDQDFRYNYQGIKNVFFGNYKNIRGASIYDLVKTKDPKLAEKIKNEIAETESLLMKVPHPFDTKVLASAKNSESRILMEEIVRKLQLQSELFKKAGKLLGVEVKIVMS